MHGTFDSQPLRHETRSLWAWESPVRRSGHRALENIPAEIYLVIFAYLRPRYDLYGSQKSDPKRINDLRSLSLVCHYFCAEILPWLFESVALCPSQTKDATGRATASCISFCSSIKRDEQFATSLAIYIKHCSIRNWFDVSEIAGRAFLDLYIETLPSFVNLTTVSLSRIRLTPPLLAHIRRLQCLTSLSIVYCDFAGILPKHVQKFASRCKLKSFRLYFHRVHEALFLISNHILEEFLPMLMHLSDLRTNTWQFINFLIYHDITPPNLINLEMLSIRSLDVMRNCVDVLNKYLCRLPALASLTLTFDDSYSRDHASSLLSLHHLKKLHRLCCPDYVLSKETSLPDKLDELCLVGRRRALQPKLFLESFGLWPDRNQLIKLSIPYALVLHILRGTSTRSRIGFERLEHLDISLDDTFNTCHLIQKPPTDNIKAMVLLLGGTLWWIVREMSSPNLRLTGFRLQDHSEHWIWGKDELTGQWTFVGKDEEGE
ncbi:hypothetical protein FB446DRAFT_770199 [Lentinula raphanica]|nr:hypothetical protein FB446DRAFT_770199 [Lentinula raphanica]